MSKFNDTADTWLLMTLRNNYPDYYNFVANRAAAKQTADLSGFFSKVARSVKRAASSVASGAKHAVSTVAADVKEDVKNPTQLVKDVTTLGLDRDKALASDIGNIITAGAGSDIAAWNHAHADILSQIAVTAAVAAVTGGAGSLLMGGTTAAASGVAMQAGVTALVGGTLTTGIALATAPKPAAADTGANDTTIASQITYGQAISPAFAQQFEASAADQFMAADKTLTTAQARQLAARSYNEYLSSFSSTATNATSTTMGTGAPVAAVTTMPAAVVTTNDGTNTPAHVSPPVTAKHSILPWVLVGGAAWLLL